MVRGRGVLWVLWAGCWALAACGGDDDGKGPMEMPDGGSVGYSEPQCDPTADISDLQAAYPAAGLRATVEGIAERRYPIGLPLIQGQRDSDLMGWFPDSPAWEDVLDGFDTAVHEGAHIWDFSHSRSGHVFWVRDDLQITTAPIQTFPRGEILDMVEPLDSDIYADLYLGMLGNQDLESLLDEYNAYVHSLASRFCTRDSLQGGTIVSARDGILTFMYYVALYLKVARTEHPDVYDAIRNDPGHVELIVTDWDRAEYWLRITEPYMELGIGDEELGARLYGGDHVAEIDRLRDGS